MGFEEERKGMVEVQLKGRKTKDKRVLEAMAKVPRHRFVEKKLQSTAYTDYPLSIGKGQTISQPYMVALMTQCLKLKGDEKVLEVGTGSGYQVAILAELAKEVYSVERIAGLARRARKILPELGYTNIKFKVGDGTRGWEEHSPYEGIMVTAGSPDIPQTLVDQLSEGGRMVIPVGGNFSQELMVVQKRKGKVEKKNICGCVFVPLIGEFGWKE
ncbi:protein-L-isoaspartate(D-aspartate) O-methyltransferase [candidate division NPL-UPA2 bacterium]|nr:protein-L-isoaspartate(D-aspartate) O-methyltransferase [candidate division NPL-UPA2 bacterium]